MVEEINIPEQKYLVEATNISCNKATISFMQLNYISHKDGIISILI